MKLYIGKKYNVILSFVANMLVLDLLWQGMELLLYGEIRPSKEDTLIAILICFYIAYNGLKDERLKQEKSEISKGAIDNGQSENEQVSH